ncbi:glycoside hydrolase family 3 C-terminal domain-containing protein [Luteimicrobium subarcticum]|uniref:Beta-glucosidase n=1 Tax=Luteimicrobium subarcticum TaxID=620910 RepID=A0A2M8WJP2_9MICO|nr:glycoside hydrolase family 3 C-terminal domain-containing protein [Luteimicrobium subarcticum]PJI91157.1 beta-glucosidase [Luteimicrobium subarcticum]
MTPDLDQSLALVTGADLMHTRAVGDVPALTTADGPNGLAMNLPDFSGKVPGTCFPSPSALASTWDAGLLERVGEAVASEARAAGADVLLAPSVNIRRSPLGGRSFEYYSEDPTVSGVLGAAFVRGVQAAGVAACVKHFAVNSQETDRMRVSAELSASALREIYLPAFERIVREASPAFVMASYNKVDGTYVSQHHELLTGILRDEWGFDGAVMSDWGAVDDPVAAVVAGLDLEMPGPALGSQAALREACTEETVRAAVLRAGARVARAARNWSDRPGRAVDVRAHHDLAVDASVASITLLRNDGVLPLAGTVSSVALVGSLAAEPHRQGGGSAGVNPLRTDDLATELRARTRAEVRCVAGCAADGGSDAALADEAVEIVARSDVAVVVVGPPPGADSEGRDRSTLEVPTGQRELVGRLCATGTPTVVVLNSGGTLLTAGWSDDAAAVLAWWLPGAGGGEALARVLVGHDEPGGRLTETIPVRLADTPTAGSFPQPGRALHAEGVLVGYRSYDRLGREVAFPFGHGIGYTTFAFGSLSATVDGEEVALAFDVTNTGARDGSTVWQVYVAEPEPSASRPLRSLAAFGRVALAPGETSTVRTALRPRVFERWDDTLSCWVTDGGAYRVSVGASSRDLAEHADVTRERRVPHPVLGPSSTLREWLTHPVLGPRLLEAARGADDDGATYGFLSNPVIVLMIGDLPIRRLFGDPSQGLSQDLLDRASS